MAVDTKEIKQKIKAVGNIQKVTKTMEMISVSKMQKAVQARKSSGLFAVYAIDLIGKIASQFEVAHPLFDKREEGVDLVVVIASDKGLCGPFNARVEKQLSEFIKDKKEVHAITIGNRAGKMAKKLEIETKREMSAFPDKVASADLEDFINEIKALYIQDDTYKSISFIYTDFISSLEFKAVTKQMLPLDESILESEGEKKQFVPYLLEPSAEEIVEEVLPMLIQISVYQFVLESLASEHSSRMLAMRNASDNAVRLKDDLTQDYNRARQAGITGEIIEIVNAAAAV